MLVCVDASIVGQTRDDRRAIAPSICRTLREVAELGDWRIGGLGGWGLGGDRSAIGVLSSVTRCMRMGYALSVMSDLGETIGDRTPPKPLKP